MSFNEQNNLLGESFFKRTFGRGWKGDDNPAYINWRGCEFILTADCNLKCSYCYLKRYGDKLYPRKLYADRGKLVDNSKMILNWMADNGYDPHMELFSGEPFIDDTSFEVLGDMVDILGPTKHKRKIMVPTNYTFLLDKQRTSQVESLLKHSRAGGRSVRLSASFDGKLMEENRPMKSGVNRRDDAYYDRCFAFNKKWVFGFHPMVYSKNIEKWKDNFLWFQAKLKKHGIPWTNIYLLEVRNKEWTKEDLVHYSDFIRFLYEYAFDKCGRDPKVFQDFLFQDKGFNILTSSLSKIGRGIGCSIQANLAIRLGDLALVTCHRTMYPQFIWGRLKTDGRKITGIEVKNPELMLAIYSLNASKFPYCANCVIRPLCPQGCLGSQYEETGDLFTPIPTVCRMYHVKVKTMIECFRDLGVYERIRGILSEEKVFALEEFERLMVS